MSRGQGQRLFSGSRMSYDQAHKEEDRYIEDTRLKDKDGHAATDTHTQQNRNRKIHKNKDTETNIKGRS